MVELPVSEHKRPEVKEANMKELEDLRNYDTFREVHKQENMRTIGSRWVITQKESMMDRKLCVKQG